MNTARYNIGKRGIRGFFEFGCICAVVLSLSAVAEGSVTLKRVDRANGVVEMTVDDKILCVRPLSDSAVRIHFSELGLAGKTELVLLPHLPIPRFTTRQDKDSIIVAMKRIRAVVDRSTGAVRFEDAAGQVFLAERPGTRLFKPVTSQGYSLFEVGQEFGRVGPGDPGRVFDHTQVPQ